MTDNKLDPKSTAVRIARLADAKKAEAVSVYDMAGRSELADFVVVVTVDNPVQLDAVDDEISINLKKEGVYAMYRDGMKSKNWKVLDYGGVIVHIFEKQAREFYSFDKVYAGYNVVKWQEKPHASGKQPAAAVRKPARKKPASAVKKPASAPAKIRTAPKRTKKPAAKKAPAKKILKKKRK
ncbi:MAG: ribosome silencing factor [Elusimicrobiales bacterium]|jgi:ribosome-associated protein